MRVPRIASLRFDWFKDQTKRLVNDCNGATSIEYAIIATLISVAIIGSVTLVGSQLNNTWIYLSNTVNPQLNH